MEIALPIITGNNFDIAAVRKGAVLCFDKPFGWSSFKLVKKVRFYSKANRVGHAGTLDPLANGLLILCTGECTKMVTQIQDLPKEYTGTFTIGSVTASFDLESPVISQTDYSGISEQMIYESAGELTGEIEQTPPTFSAVKIGGTRAYKLARQGVSMEMKSRKTTIMEFEITGIQLPEVHFRIRCSKGTYIRSMANDFGKKLGVGAHLSQLTRTKTGHLTLDSAFQPDAFQTLCGF